MEFYSKRGMCLNHKQGHNWLLALNISSVGMHKAYGYHIVILCV